MALARLSLFAFLLLAAAIPAHAEPITRMIERPLVRFILTETAEGRALINRMLEESPKRVVSTRDLRFFGETLDAGHPLRDSIELRLRSAELDAERLRKIAKLSGGGFDAAKYLREYAARELALTPATEGFRFPRAAGESVGALRDRFVLEGALPEASAAAILARLGAKLRDHKVILSDVEKQYVEFVHVGAAIEWFRSFALEVAVYSKMQPRAFRPLRVEIVQLRNRLSHLVHRTVPGPRGFNPNYALHQGELYAKIAETQLWFGAAGIR